MKRPTDDLEQDISRQDRIQAYEVYLLEQILKELRKLNGEETTDAHSGHVRGRGKRNAE